MTGRSQRHLQEIYGIDSAGEPQGGGVTPPPSTSCLIYPLDAVANPAWLPAEVATVVAGSGDGQRDLAFTFDGTPDATFLAIPAAWDSTQRYSRPSTGYAAAQVERVSYVGDNTPGFGILMILTDAAGNFLNGGFVSGPPSLTATILVSSTGAVSGSTSVDWLVPEGPTTVGATDKVAFGAMLNTADTMNGETMTLRLHTAAADIDGYGFPVAANDFCGDEIGTPPVTSCVFPLEGTLSDFYSTFGVEPDPMYSLATRPTPQSATRTATSGIIGLSVASSSNNTYVTWSAPLTALEANVVLPATAGGAGSMLAQLALGSAGATLIGVNVIANSDGLFSLQLLVDNIVVISQSGLASCPTRLGFLFNTAPTQHELYVDGVSAGAFTSSAMQGIPAISIAELNLAGANAGAVGTIELITDASLMTQPYPLGAVDPCGNPIEVPT